MIYTKQEWYTPAEVALHNKATDCWVSVNGVVRNLTSWLKEQFRICNCIKSCSCPVKSWFCEDTCVEHCNCFKRGFSYCDGKRLAMAVLAYAGKDLSHWFNGDNWAHFTHPLVGSITPYHRHGPGNEQPVVPSTRWRPITNPWWLDENNVVGKVTERTRPIRITNTLTGSSVTLEVCSEETIYQIMMRYLPHNYHMLSYTWRYLDRGLDYNKTLAENGIPDERDLFSEVSLPENIHIPDILLFYNDDLTEDPPRSVCFCRHIGCVLNECQEKHEVCSPNMQVIKKQCVQ
ncbi:cytochrome b5 domain-containing protein 1 [Vanessa atalanta]|uniref:cytochrome b5 domain-containing protein 1 n=1 Tax=Vanessa atalanta TaxID=42275 RepID=UPI001FCD0F62|nr:cytochrome b5 domain-containing protein 1 [Vanessa atalanta]